MANTISVSTGLAVKSGSTFFLSSPQATKNVAQTGTGTGQSSQVIPTTAGGTAIAIPSGIGSAGWATFQNLDPTNYVDIGVQVSGAFETFGRLLPGDPPAQFRLSTLTIYALANTASVQMLCKFAEG